jgi:hypothetical protein
MITTIAAWTALAFALLSFALVVRLYVLVHLFAKTVNESFTSTLNAVSMLNQAAGADNKAVADLQKVMQDILDIATTPASVIQYTVNSKANRDAN